MAPKQPEVPAVIARAEADDRVGTLRAMRDLIARQLADPTTPARELAALTGRMQALLAEIAELAPPATKGTALDELADRRRDRGAAPARKSAAPRG